MVKRSLIAKMLLLIFLPTLFMLTLCGAVVTFLAMDSVEDTVKSNIAAQNRLIATQLSSTNNQLTSFDWIKESGYTEINHFVVYDSFNTILFSSDEADTGKQIGDLFKDASALTSLTQNAGVPEMSVVKGNPSICVINPIDGANASFMTLVPLVHISEKSGSLSRTLILVFAGILALTFVVIMISTRLIIKPINKLKDASLQIAEGNFFVTVDVRSKDEIGQLAAAIKRIVQRLSNYVLYIDEITEVLTSVSAGDLTYSLRNDYIGEFASIKDALLKISDSLNKTMSGINNAAEQVSSGSIQVSGASQALSQGSTQQASAIEELSSTIRDVNRKVKLNAESAKDANSLSHQTVENVERCSELMRSMLESMEKINDASSNIKKIIKVIDDISFQTNILALNAAVEAARAGAAGKGFAVVADEVRNLATKSAQAAKNTTELIESSLKAVEDGVGLAERTASALEQIVQDANDSSKLIGDITIATNDQATAVMQITQGVEQISSVVETNSATAQQTAAASEELSSQADVLKRMTSHFKLKGEDEETEEHADFCTV